MDIHPFNLIIPALILAPNIAYAFVQPTDTAKAPRTPAILTILEKAGQVGMVSLPLFFSLSPSPLLYSLMALAVCLYYAAWVRYFKTRKRKDLYRPFLSIPLPLAVLPVIYFFIAALAFNVAVIYAAWVALAIGHIAVTYYERLKSISL